MKELTKILIEAGIVDKTTTKLLQKWGSLSPEEIEHLNQKQVMFETMDAFLEELELLLQPESIERKTISLVIKE